MDSDKDDLEAARDRAREEALESLRRLARPFPPGFKFDREEIHERGSDIRNTETEPEA
ncbi:MAG: hypothetical protein ACRD45_07930 [Bryobacteraceae bacterium]